MLLSGSEIKKEILNGHININPFHEEKIQPNSIDLTLAPTFAYYGLAEEFIKIGQLNEQIRFEDYGLSSIYDPEDDCVNYHRFVGVLDTRGYNKLITETIPEEGIILFPRVLYLFKTNEVIWSDKYVAEVSGKSTLARLGISVHKTAGYANVGHEFAWVLEVEVTHPIRIYKDMEIAAMYFHEVKGDLSVKYTGKHAKNNINW